MTASGFGTVAFLGIGLMGSRQAGACSMRAIA